MTDLQKEVQFIKGVGPARAGLLNRLGVHTVEDLLYYIPYRYEDRSNIRPIREISPLSGDSYQTVQGEIISARVLITPRQRKKIFEAAISDGTGYVTAKWFNQVFLKDIIRKGRMVVLSGYVRMDSYGHGLYIDGPEFEIIDAKDGELLHTGRIVPIYHITNGLTQKTLRSIIRGVLDTCNITEILSRELLDKYHLPALNDTVNNIHFPPEGSDVDKFNRGETRVHKRLSFEEFFLLETGLAMKKLAAAKKRGIAFRVDGTITDRLYSQLPFNLTSSQQRVINEIKNDMAVPCPMNRLLQGDVGCGKTVVALTAMLIAVQNGYQAAMMAPTEVLAEQHYRNIKAYLDHLGVTSCILRSGVKVRDKETARQNISEGNINIIIGTHAMLDGDIRFKCLGLAVIDEQHKFGVLQRATLKDKGYNPDMLIMTATPIPRTLALSVYGDLEVSIIDELPPGRKPVKTRWLHGKSRKDAYYIMQEELRKGRQSYVIYPLVVESEKIDLKNATEMAVRLQKAFPDRKVGLLHGRMKSNEKEEVMDRFKKNDIQVLVSTTVVEVGVDIANATVIVIEHAERFGLSQLHQLRGRVGRGENNSICLLLTGENISDDGRRRLNVMERTNDGFELAEEDLSIRGPGEFFGTRQAGIPELKVANILRDAKILEVSRKEAFELVRKDPFMEREEHKLLRHAMERKWKERLELATVS